MPPEAAAAQSQRHLTLVPRQLLRVADVTVFYGERSGGIRTYLDAKMAYVEATGAYEHHLIIPGAGGRRGATTVHGVASVEVNRANGYRVPLRGRGLLGTLRELRPDVVLLHDPCCTSAG